MAYRTGVKLVQICESKTGALGTKKKSYGIKTKYRA